MSSDPEAEKSLRETTRAIAGHKGVLGVHPVAGTTSLEIEFDPSALTDDELRDIASGHAPGPSLLRRTMRLDNKACEACAIRLEDRIKKIPGVRKATATYLGRILCLTFDRDVSAESEVMDRVRAAGARIEPYSVPSEPEGGLLQRIRSGSLNEELSVLAGFVFLVASFICEHTIGPANPTTLALYAGAYLFCGQNGVRSAIASLRERVLDIDVLMVLAAIGAALVGQPFEGALLLFLFSFSNVLQGYALERTRKAIHSLLKLRPDKALVRRGGDTEIVPVADLEVGDIVVLRPGEHVPVDGTVVEGSSHLDESSLTGEPMPVSKSAGARLFSGTLNQGGGLEFRVTRRAEDSTLARMVKLVEEAQAEKSRTQRFLERAEQYYATGVIAFTALVFAVPFLLLGEGFDEAFYRAMTVMVVASPCALVISTPATVLSAIGGAARRGILVKGGSHLERLSRIDIVAFDKTGTLTNGRPVVTRIIDHSGIHPIDDNLPPSARALLTASAALESKSEHPLAAAVVRGARAAGLPIPAASDFTSIAGKGAEATVEGRRLVVGSERFFLESNALHMDRPAGRADTGETPVWIGERTAEGLEALGILCLADTLRPAAPAMIARLHELGVKKVVMLTGDQRLVADSIAAAAGIDEARAELLPEDKVLAIRELKQEGRVMMVGDGVNDAPALATADVGTAMGAAGTDIAMETADAVLMGDKLENIPELLAIARRARTVLLQNLVFASAVIVILLAATFGVDLPLPMGVVGHEGSTVLVCLNGLRLLARGPGK
jgi:Zn2+/Cd2+-exporting ATPase